MKIFEVLRFVATIDQAIVNEGFKELTTKDKFKATSEEEKNKAREVYQELIKNDSIKNEFIKGKTGNIDQMIEKTYNSLSEFINGIAQIKTAVKERAKQKKAAKDATFREKAMANAGKNISKDAAKYAQYLKNNWYIIPCHIYEEVRDSAKALTGNLPTGFADSYIEGKWVIDKQTCSIIEAEPNGININNLDTNRYEKIKKPKPGQYAKTSLNPIQYLNVYKTAPFFMQPSWCIAGSENGKGFFEGSYHLKTEKDEEARCYVVISADYPNVRFCITYEVNERVTIQGNEPDNIIDDDYLRNARVLYDIDCKVNEVRDPWQIGTEKDTGLEMIQSMPELYGKIKNLLNDRNVVKSSTPFLELKKSPGNLFGKFKNIIEVTANFSNLKHGNELFKGNKKLKEFNGKLPNLTDGKDMFFDTGLKSWGVPLPNLKDAHGMFSYTKLTSWDVPLPNLIRANHMFKESLKEFNGKLPKLKDGSFMFVSAGLTSWNTPLPSLKNGDYMFSSTKLTSWDTPLPNLKYGESMFAYTKLTSWNTPLPNLVQAMSMFAGCKLDEKSVYNILNSIPSYSDNEWHEIGIGVGYSIDQEEIEQFKEKFAEKGWTLELS